MTDPDGNSKRLLFAAWLFPPHGGASALRNLGFVKHLPNHGILPQVLSSTAPFPLMDPSLLDQIPPGVHVFRARYPRLPLAAPFRLRKAAARWVLAVDEQLPWVPFAVRLALRLHRQQPFDAVFSTSAPFSSHIAGLWCARLLGLPFAADFHDPWAAYLEGTWPTPLHARICRGLETAVVREARLVVTVTEAMRDGFLRRYPDLPPERFHVIENGFDPEIFDSVSPAPRDRRLTLVHAGSFLAARSPRSFFEALRTVLDEGLVPREEIRVLLVGSAGKEAARLREEMGLADVVAMTGFVPHTECLARQRSADALLLVLPEGESRSDAHTSKLLEYLAAGKPVLALAPEGAAAELLAEAGMRRVVRPEDSRGIVRELRRLYQDWRQGALTDRPASGVAERRARAAQCAKLAGLFREKVFAERGAGGKV